MRTMREVIEIDEALCDGCGKCVPSCHEGAIQVINGKARLVGDKYCDGLGACIGECPKGALKVVKREAEDFDEAAVKARLAAIKVAAQQKPTASGCPGAQIRRFGSPAHVAAGRNDDVPASSALRHWPIQIRLVPPTAPFLEGADLLVAADCVPFAYAAFHRELLAGKVVLVGCPKFDDVSLYVERFADIFSTSNIKSVTVAVMEVPCCGQMPRIVAQAMDLAGRNIPAETVVVSLDGRLLARQAGIARTR